MVTTEKRGEVEQEPSVCPKSQSPDSRRLWLDVPPQAVIRVVPRTRWWAATVVNGAMRRVTVKFR
ncbi:hypothetical protein JG687_00017208 [Phytophthora cactorum]|uniref:Uncharacterized protein n=1 Tax=Phytophthora cactorum TaxID=29920 RepID=A0A8T1TNV3_9STRA|nr:hypothetical protein JG687_00017208 [Phytophthora cactorum]